MKSEESLVAASGCSSKSEEHQKKKHLKKHQKKYGNSPSSAGESQENQGSQMSQPLSHQKKMPIKSRQKSERTSQQNNTNQKNSQTDRNAHLTSDQQSVHSRKTQKKASSTQNSSKRGQNSGNIPKAKMVYEPYWSIEDVTDGLKRNQLLLGTLRINPRNYEDAYVPHPDGVSDIYIAGQVRRNRALNGDTVVVLLDDQFTNEDLEMKERRIREQMKKLGVRDDDIDRVAKASTAAGSQLRENEEVDVQRTGKVVFIYEAKHSRAASGQLRLRSDKSPDLAFFAPADHRVPRMMIPMKECPKGFYERPQDSANTLFVARISDWPENSPYPTGTLFRSLGEAGDIEPETEAILLSNDIDSSDFSPEVLDCLPSDLPWKIPAEEYEKRRDFRQECVFTIDPSTARDLDDALHCIQLDEDLFEIGVHIADVSYFVKPDTSLDTMASSRATSVYLVQKVIPMLPRLLCEQLCSLNPADDRLTFSVVWKMRSGGEILDEWFGRSIIRSCVKLAYDHAQGFIDDPDKEWSLEELPSISDNFSVAQIKKSVLNLHKVAKQLRQNRFDNGALRLDQLKLSYSLDTNTGLPNGYYVYKQKESNRLVEEFMLLANMAVAHKIYKTYPEQSVLRRHPPPQTKMITELVSTCKSLGINLDVRSAGDLQRSLSAYTGEEFDQQAKAQILVAMCSKPMQVARYFCTGCIEDQTKFHHYALNVPLYTHFTSPIRRYPDILVHRLLSSALGYAKAPTDDKQMKQKKAEHCNDKKTAAKQASDQSGELYFAAFVKECGPLEEPAMVMGVLDKAFDVLILRLGVVKRVYCEQLALSRFEYRRDHKRPELTLTWATDDAHHKEVVQVVTIFTKVNVILMSDPEQGMKWKALAKHPENNIV